MTIKRLLSGDQTLNTSSRLILGLQKKKRMELHSFLTTDWCEMTKIKTIHKETHCGSHCPLLKLPAVMLLLQNKLRAPNVFTFMVSSSIFSFTIYFSWLHCFMVLRLLVHWSMMQTSVGISGLEVKTGWTSGSWAGVQNDQLHNQKHVCADQLVTIQGWLRWKTSNHRLVNQSTSKTH